MDLELNVTLVVKAPNQKIDDQTIECALGWTIKKLKEHISRVYPSRPREHQQKLIYSGRLLNDHLMLKDILRQYDEELTTHTMHLVCASSPADQAQPNTQDTVTNNSSSNSSASSSREGSPASSAPASPPAPPLMEGLRHRRSFPVDNVPLPTTTATTTPQPAPDTFQNMYGANVMYGGNFYPGMVPPGMMAYSPEQLMWLQQMYAQQMAQYMQLYQGAIPATPPASPVVNTPQQAAPADQNVAPINQAANRGERGGDQPIMMNAQGGMVVDDDDDMNRDWLDWMYTLSRVAVLLSIVYFYSTFGRFVLVLSLFIMAYLYQGGWFRIQRRVQQVNAPAEPAQQQQAADPAPQQPPEPPMEGQQQQDQTSDEEESTAAEEPPEPVEPPRPGHMTFAWSFFYTFFSSLIPQQPPALNAN